MLDAAAEAELLESLPGVRRILLSHVSLDEALRGRETLIAPTEPSVGVRVAFILDDGAPVELLQFCTAPGGPAQGQGSLPSNA